MFRVLSAPLLVAASIPNAFALNLEETPLLPGAGILPGAALSIEADFTKHQVSSPTALTFDAQGRIYITETHRFAKGIEDDRDHLYWYLDDLAATKVSDRRALHEKWKDKLPLSHMTAETELVRRLSDTDGDGKLDESKVFADGFNDVLDGTAAGIYAYEGTLYLACIPKLMMLRDTNNDGSADERKTIADGFGVRVSLSGHDLNGFALGPDGRIYGTMGDRGFSFTSKEGKVFDYPNEGAVFRFEPDGTGFELFHTGLRNPKEIAFDALGNPITVDNNSDQKDRARVVYLAEGADSGWQMEHQAMFSFHRQIGLEELPPSRWMDEIIWHTVNPDQPAFIVPPIAYLTSGPSGLTYHPGTGFLESESGRFFITDYRGSAATSGIWSFETKPDGAGMKLVDSRKIVSGIAATDVEFSWDGKLFITDFIGGWTSRVDGRLLSLDAGEKKWRARETTSVAKIMREGFEQRSGAELANLLKHPDSRIRLHAQVALTRKPDALKHFSDGIESSDFMVRVHSIWGLGILARRGASPLPASEFGSIPSGTIRKDAETKLLTLLKDKDDEIRCQTLRALCDASTPSAAPLQLGPLLADPSLRVRYFAAILTGKRKMVGSYGQICDMLAENNNRDPMLRHAGAFALQNLFDNTYALRALATHDSAAVRLAAVVALRRLKSQDLYEFIRDADPKVADEAIRAITDLDLTSERSGVAAVLDQLGSRQWSPFMLRRLIHNSFRLGDAANAERVFRFAADATQPEAVRKEAFRLLSIWNKPHPADQLTGHWRPLPEREPAILRDLLSAKLPALMNERNFVLGEALGLMDTHGIKIPTVDAKALRGFANDAQLPDAARSKAIELLGKAMPDDFEALLVPLVREAPDTVAITALRQLAKLNPSAAVAPVEAALADGKRPMLARESWKLLATISGSAADALFTKHLDTLTKSQGISPHALELIEAAGKRSDPAVAAALTALNKSLTENPDPLAKWNVTLQGGDAKTGSEIFTSHPTGECMRCHRVGDDHDIGGMTAPNLSGIGKRHQDRRYFLESLLKPSAVIATGFGAVSVDFKNGANLSGNVIASTPEHIDLEYKSKPIRIRRADVASVSEAVSAMPPMGDLLNPTEIRDLVAWLASLTEELAAAPAAATPELFDPSALTANAKTPSALDPELLKQGRTQFIVCGACHGQNGEGTAAGPPLAGSEWVTGPVENLIRIQLRGLQGPITVKGQTYNFPAGMAALAYQNDEQIAAVLSYVRNSFGNSASPVSAAEVAALRGEVGKPPVTVADLVPPTTAAATPAPAANQSTTDSSAKPQPNAYDNLKPSSSLPKWIAIGAVLAAALVVIVLKSRSKTL